MNLSSPIDEVHASNGRQRGVVILVDALAARFGGTAYAATEASLELSRHERVDRVTVVTRRESIVARGIAESGTPIPLELLQPEMRGELAHRIAWEATALPRLAKREEADALLTFSGMLPRTVGCQVVAILANPVMFQRHGLINYLRRWAVRRTVRKGASVLVPSQEMARLVSRGVERSPKVVPFGIDHATFRPGHVGAEVICVADFYPHKRHDIVLSAWRALPEPRPRLRLIGNPAVSPRQYSAMRRRAADLADLGEIVWQSGLPVQRLASAYRRARVFVLPSMHESFCLPLAESLASGVPAVVRDLPQLRETGGGGAVYIEGDEASKWSIAMSSLLMDDRRHAAIRRAGIAYAASYSWRTFADAIVSQIDTRVGEYAIND